MPSATSSVRGEDSEQQMTPLHAASFSASASNLIIYEHGHIPYQLSDRAQKILQGRSVISVSIPFTKKSLRSRLKIPIAVPCVKKKV